ncbi:Gp15 family bacteriophage protein [Enterocloster bolteae]|mgnify:FL=1|jgi:hypothetical protein|uniref:Gp15 family bacteriophage protein n=1 Tax=Enterocloster bolteae TaxID=208479 RepID=UPI0002D20BD7|nr:MULTISPECIES: Gp15 family bacteriophage protein [Enterocloster]ENZ36699.1 hypothetical protein HMPREF1089_05785 [Enterocloster bolteae 90B3]MBS7003285.1 hypothetical protein [Enterocloster clostridioformis]RGB91068.1 hypothetical protein DWZ21_29700 [Hungatella hathewayi]
MSAAWSLPYSLSVNGVNYEIREDFRAILDILSAFADEELSDPEKTQAMLEILYWPVIPPPQDLTEAAEKALWFIDCGVVHEDIPLPRVIDWEQDAGIIFPAVNRIAGFETRGFQIIHWWTFYGWFMEIGDGLFSQVLSIRQKLSKGKRLEKWEQEFLQNNKKLCELEKSTDKSKEEFDYFAELLK